MEFLLVVVLIVLFVRWIILSRRMKEMENRIAEATANRSAAEDATALVRRVYKLEAEVRRLRAERSSVVIEAPAVAVKPVEQPAAEPAPPPIPKVCSFCGNILPPFPAICECRTVAEAKEPAAVSEPEPVESDVPYLIPPTPEPSAPAFTARVREKMAGEEWEAIVGGSWLNKLGVFVLVIGIALFLGYSFTGMSPAGRAATAVAVSLVLLGGGVILERRDRYRIIGRGLLGGGWAALYFSTYAMQAVDAAKVISSDLLGGALLLAVAAGMILHSLRYRSQTVTGLAYFVAFVTLAITPITALSVVALIPLAGSLLYVAYRFEWSSMALLGLVATYGTCASRGDSGAPLSSAQILFSIYWLLFEGFDLLRASKRTEYQLWESAILPLNALGFAGLSYAKWPHDAPQMLYALAGGVAAAYLASTALRAKLRPPSSFADGTSTLERALWGGFEGPITLTAILTATAVLLKFHGGWANVGLLAEAELLFLAGILFRQGYPRELAAALFSVGIGKLLGLDVPGGGEPVNVVGWGAKPWTPVAALAGALFYINRVLRPSDKAYGYAASAMFAWLLAFEAPERYLALAWFAFAAVLFLLGWFRRLEEFRIQAYAVAVLGFGATADHQLNIASGAAPRLRYPWVSLAGAALSSYAGVLCALRSAADRLKNWERVWLRRAGSWATTAALVALVWRIVPTEYVGLGWLALALPILELGLRRAPDEFETQSLVATSMGAIYVLLTNVLPIRNDSPVHERLIPAVAAVVAYLFAARVFAARKGGLAVDLSSAMGSLFLMFSLWALLPVAIVAPAWALVSVLLIETGLGLDLPSLRLQGHLSGAAAFGRLFFANFTGLGATGVISHRLLTVIPVVGSHYYQWSKQRACASRLEDWESQLGRAYLYAAAIGVVVLLRFELDRLFVVIGWAVFSLVLLILGRKWEERDLRWQSYAIAALTFWRSTTADFLGGTAERIVTASIVIACFFAAQLVIPQSNVRTGIERYARLFFSALATLLLTSLLFHEVSGSILTVAWGLEAVFLLTAGFPLRDRILRLFGLALFLVCILKLFLYDLRQLETGYRILSFIALGVILMGVSWIYTRFRDRIQQFL